MLDILEMASLDEIIDAKDLISKEVICQETHRYKVNEHCGRVVN